MVFDKEQWLVIGDTTPQRCLGVVDNTVLVRPKRGSSYKVCIRVPSGLFSFLKNALGLSVTDLKAKPVKFFLEEDRPGEWCFVMATLARTHAIDMWPYKGLPGWAEKGRCL